MIPKYIKKLQSESRTLRARRVDAQTVIVESETHPESYYEVTVKFNDAGVVYATCTCEWAKHNGVGCSHVLAALDLQLATLEPNRHGATGPGPLGATASGLAAAPPIAARNPLATLLGAFCRLQVVQLHRCPSS